MSYSRAKLVLSLEYKKHIVEKNRASYKKIRVS